MAARLLITVLALCMWSGAARHATAENLLEMNESSWVVHSQKPKDSQVVFSPDGIRISRHADDYYLRMYQDVSVRPGGLYELTYRMRVQGNGSAGAWVIMHDKQLGWLEDRKSILYAPMTTQGGWQAVTLQIPAYSQVDTLRIAFGPKGKNTSAQVDRIQLAMPWKGRARVSAVPAARQAPVLDGQLDEPQWDKAAWFDDFRVLGDPASEASVQTRVAMLIAGDDLYLAYRADEPNASGMVVETLQNRIGVYTDDCIETFLATSPTGDMIQLALNAKGFGDAQYLVNTQRPSVPNWYASIAGISPKDWDASSKQYDDHWIIEARIDLNKLYPAASPTDRKNKHTTLWVNFGRNRPQDSSHPHSNWAGLTGNTFHAPQQFRPVRLAWRPSSSPNAALETNRLAVTQRWESPELLISGRPLWLQHTTGALKLPRSLRFVGDVAIAPDVRAMIRRGVCQTDGPATPIEVRCDVLPDDWQAPQIEKTQAKLLEGPEAFRLILQPDRIHISGRSREGVLRGLATLSLMGAWAKQCGRNTLPSLTMIDAPKMVLRGWFSASRDPEALKREIDVSYRLRFNMIMFELSSYGKDAVFPFESHPDVSRTHTTKAQWRELAEYAKARGIRLVPKFYSWSRAGFILNKKRYQHLAVEPGRDRGVRSGTSHDRNFDAYQEESYSLLFDLYQEIIDVLKVTDLHIGHDEVHYDALVTSPAARKAGATRSDWLVRTVQRTHDFLTPKGVRLWIYADMLDPGMNGKFIDQSGPALLARLPKDIVLQDWRYHNDGPTYPSLKMFHDAGFPTVASPWFTPMNIAGIIRDADRYGVRGFCGTSWSATDPKNIPSELATAWSLGAYLSWSPQDHDLSQFPFIPALLYQAAAYRYGRSMPSSVDAARCAPVPDGAHHGPDAVAALGFGVGSQLLFWDAIRQDAHGVPLTPFHVNNMPAVAIAQGGKKASVTIPLQGTARELTILHTLNAQKFLGSMHQFVNKYRDVNPGRYVLEYADGTDIAYALKMRRDVCAWDDPSASSEAPPALFGTLAHKQHINLTTYTIKNPFPSKPLKALKIMGGDKPGIDLAVLAVTMTP